MLFSKILSVLTEYCENSTLAGVSYILERSFHYTERVFWLVCVLASTLCAVGLVLLYLDLFETNAVSLVVERWKSNELVKFPAVVVCENGLMDENYPGFQDIVNGLEPKNASYDYEVEDFIFKLLFINLYSRREFQRLCGNKCKNCKMCPDNHYKEIAEVILANCSTLFESCIWKGKEFDCCTYFRPIQTSIGKCFAMGSLHSENNANSNMDHMNFDWKEGSGILNVTINRAVMLYILNEEDIPETIMSRAKKGIITLGIGYRINILLFDVASDRDVRRVQPKYRKCLFPDEVPSHYVYKYYSSSICMTEWIRRVQLKECNCISHNIPGNESLTCSYEGYICLDNKDILYPLTHQHLVEISTENLECLPSCNERMIHISEVQEMFNLDDEHSRRFELAVLPMAAVYYRRQAVRTYLDIFVSIGGILGLFTGASVLSYVEIVYYFTWKLLEAVISKSK